jgi:hypothetical protein
MNLNIGELNSFYNVCGYLVNSINNNFKTCSKCILFVGSKTANNLRFSKLTQIKRYKQNSLFFCNEITFLNFIDLEPVFRKYYDVVSIMNIDIKNFYLCKMLDLDVFSHVLSCHNLKKNIISRFISFRLKISGRRKLNLRKKYASKSLFRS